MQVVYEIKKAGGLKVLWMTVIQPLRGDNAEEIIPIKLVAVKLNLEHVRFVYM